MKTFKDLKFEEHGVNGCMSHAELFFPNGYGISVITGEQAYSTAEEPYEIAVLKGNKEDSDLTDSTSITDDVIGPLTEKKVTKVMEDIQKLKGMR